MASAPTLGTLRAPFVTRKYRAYFAPVSRAAGQATIFDPAVNSGFSLDAPPAPWVELGWVDGLVRTSESRFQALASGVPALPVYQVRAAVGAMLSLRFLNWSKVTMALASGAQHMNLLNVENAASTPVGSGGVAAPAIALGAGSTASELTLAGTSSMTVGAMVVVDVDYTGQIGFVGSGVSGGYVRESSDVNTDANYIRRVSYNVGRVVGVTGNTLQLAQPLIAGVPAPSMKVQQIAGFVDREGGSFFQEWSGLFVAEGEQGDRLMIHYPRLQAASAPGEIESSLAGDLHLSALQATFRAMPVLDSNDNAQVVCYRAYIPGPLACL